MRAFIPDYQMIAPATLAAALHVLKNEPGVWKPFAGGTDLMVLLDAGKLDDKQYLSLRHFSELRGIVELSSDHVTIGALTTYTDVLRSSLLCAEFPLLARAARETGSVATQNRGTLGGNIANASPAADSPPALLVYDAELELVSARGGRWVPYHSFHQGYKSMDLRPDELIGRIRLPRTMRGWKQYYRKVGTRHAQAISKVCFAGAALWDEHQIRDTRISLGSVAPTVIRATRTEAVLRGQGLDYSVIRVACEELAREIAPI